MYRFAAAEPLTNRAGRFAAERRFRGFALAEVLRFRRLVRRRVVRRGTAADCAAVAKSPRGRKLN